MTKDEALKLALEALEYAEAGLADIGDADREPGDDLAWCERRAAQALPKTRATITAIQEALAQPEQEPVCDYRTRYDRGCYKCGSHYCPADCPEPAHLVPKQPEQDKGPTLREVIEGVPYGRTYKEKNYE